MSTSRDELKLFEPVPSKNGIFHPRSVDELKILIEFAKKNNAQIRTIGAAHSPQPAIYDEKNKNQLKVILDGSLRKIQYIKPDESKEFAIVSVNAGCNLGVNPADKSSTLENSFNFQVDKSGYALPTLGGISHQTIAGFLQTSSSGGSAKHGIADAIEAIEWMNGKGELCHAKKGDKEFDAVVVSLGMFGIITNVTFKLPKRYLVKGIEENKEFKDSVLVKDAKGQYSELDKALYEDKDQEYGHLNWLPQSGVERIMQWKGKAVDPSTPVVSYDHPLSSRFKTILAMSVLTIGNLIDKFGKNSKILKDFKAMLLKTFSDPKDRQEFCDVWYKTLPIDDQADVDCAVKTLFSELWFPRDQMHEVMKRLEELFKTNPDAAGNFIVELYPAKKSPYWLSPSYGHDAFRVDLYWWAGNMGDPEKYFGIFWEKLLDIPCARLHWGKFLPKPGEQYGERTFVSKDLYSEKNYPKLPEWLELRDKNDPQQLFVTDYWRRIFDIPLKLKNVSELEEKPGPGSPADDSYVYQFLGYLGLYRSVTPSSAESKIDKAPMQDSVSRPIT